MSDKIFIATIMVILLGCMAYYGGWLDRLIYGWLGVSFIAGIGCFVLAFGGS